STRPPLHPLFPYTTLFRSNLAVMGRGLFFALLGLIAMGLLQLFIPSLRTGGMELLISGAGVVIFALFTAYDVQRVQTLARSGQRSEEHTSELQSPYDLVCR